MSTTATPRPPPRFGPPHPWFTVWAVAWAAQMTGLFVHSFGTDPSGQPMYSSPVNTLIITVPLYTCWLLLLATGAGAIWRVLPFARKAVALGSAVAAAALVLLTQIDFGMQHFRGERLSLAHFRSYSPDAALNSDVFRPVLERPSYPIVTLGIAIVAWLTLAGLLLWARRSRAEPRFPPTWRRLGHCLLAAALCYAPLKTAYYHQRDMAQPPYVLMARSVIFPTEPMTPEKELRLRAALRRQLDPSGESRWLSDRYPLLRAHPAASSASAAAPSVPADPPDIVIFVVESLRGHDVGWGLHPRSPGQSVTPQLDALAKQSVTFPRYIANGDPSPRGFIGINTGLWEHRWGFIIANFPNLASDSLPGRLRSAHGYRTMALWGGNPSFDNQLVWARRWYDEVDFQLPGNDLFYFNTRPDRVVMDHFIERVRAHDVRAPGQPLFAYVSSNGTHTPYDPEDGEPLPPGASAQERYDRCLRHIDREIARVVAFLDGRPRAKNTVVIVIGDHSDKTTDPIDPALRGLPTDPLVWTAALIRGPERLVGLPGERAFPASHVDLLPTVLAWVGDRQPWVGFGQNLFDDFPETRRTAVAVNSRGYRLDRGGHTLIVDSANPKNFFAYTSFPAGQTKFLPLAETPFAADESAALADEMVYWSYLVEENRVWPGADGPLPRGP